MYLVFLFVIFSFPWPFLQSLMDDDDWDKAMAVYRKLMPSRTHVLMTATNRPLPRRLTIRTGKADSTKISVQILDSAKKVLATAVVHALRHSSSSSGPEMKEQNRGVEKRCRSV